MADKTLATFRIDLQEWEAFKNAATTEGVSASALLTEFVRWYLAGNRLNAPTASTPTTLDNTSERLDTTLALHLDCIDEMIDKRMEGCLDNKLEERKLTPESIKEQLEEHTAYLAQGLNIMIGELQAQIEELRGKSIAR